MTLSPAGRTNRQSHVSTGTAGDGMDMNTSPLTPGQREQIREELLRALAKIERSMKTTDRAARPVKLDQTSVGRLSRIDALQNQGLTRGLQQREHAKHAQITEALRRIDSGSYGICEGCGQPIQFERLLIFPEALACGGCGDRS